MKSNRSSWSQFRRYWRRYIALGAVAAIGLVLFAALVADLLVARPCSTSRLNADICRLFVRATWDWIGLFTILWVIVIFAWVILQNFKRRNRDKERQVILRSYFGAMTNLFLDKSWTDTVPPTAAETLQSGGALELLAAAHTATLEVLPKLDGVRKGAVLKFLSESGRLQQISLAAADFEGTLLTNANLQGANLVGANLVGANLVRANFEGANLEGAYLGGAFLVGANFSQAHLVGTNLVQANLEGGNFEGANLIGANLVRANLDNANFSGADLRGTNLRKTVLVGASLAKANLEGANLSEANLKEALFLSAKLVKTNLKGAKVDVANLNDAYLCCTTLPDSVPLDSNRDCHELGLNPKQESPF